MQLGLTRYTSLGLVAAVISLFLSASLAPGAVLQTWAQRLYRLADEAASLRRVALDPAGNVVISGASCAAKYAALDGTLLWQRNFTNYSEGESAATALGVDASGNVFITGFSTEGTNGYGFYTAKYAATNGAVLWEATFDGPAHGHDIARALAVDGFGNVIVTGESFNGTNADFVTIKYSGTNGAVLWKRQYGGVETDDDSPVAIAVDAAGNVFVTGSSATYDTDYYTAKYSGTNGTVLWEQRYDDAIHSEDYAFSLAVDGHGDVIVTGFSEDGDFGYSDCYTIKYSGTNGAVLWAQRYNGPANVGDHASAIAIDPDGNAVITGYSFNALDVPEYVTVKYAGTNGALMWVQRFSNGGGQGDYASSVGVDARGNVFVSGASSNENDYDIYTVKYAATNGAVLWEKRYDGPAGGDDFAVSTSALAVSRDGMVAITGASDGDETLSDYLTIVYREALPSLSIQVIPAGALLSFPGVAGQSYHLESAPAVTGPWTTNATVSIPTNGIIQYTDTNALHTTTFYRTSAN